MHITERKRAEIALIFAALIWSLTFPFVKILNQSMNAFTLIFFRSLIGLCVFIPFILFKKEDRKLCVQLSPFGFLLGFLLYLCYLFQTFGLETIPAGKSAFLTNLTIIFVPLTSVLFQRSTPVLSDIISSCIALTGLYFLTDPFYGEGLSKGELWTILSAFCFSFYIQYLQIFIEKKGHAKIFSFLQIFFMTFFASICLLFLPSGSFFFPINFLNIFSLFYLGAIAMVATLLLQSFYQYKTTPERATVIYLLEPVFAIFFGYLILNEKMSPRGFLGAFLMIFAVIWVYFIYRKKY